jgi:hypothetical protein
MPALARSQKPDPESASPAATPPADAQLAVKIVARVDDTPILEQELREATYPHLTELIRLPEPLRSERRKQIQQEELQRLIERELVLREIAKVKKVRPSIVQQLEQDADKEFDKRLRELKAANGFTTDEALKAALVAQGMTLDGMRKQVRRTFMMKEYVEQRIIPGLRLKTAPAYVREYYDQHPQDFRTEDGVVWQDLFLDSSRYGGRDQTRRTAAELAKQVHTDDDFVALVDRHDCGDSRLRKGVGTGEKRGEIRPPQMEGSLFQMQPGEMRLVEFDSGVHLIRLAKRTFAGLRPWDDKATQEEAKKKLTNLVFEREYRRLMNEIRSGAAIMVTEEP